MPNGSTYDPNNLHVSGEGREIRISKSDRSAGTVVYSPKQAAACFLIGAPLLYISNGLSGWLEWIVGGIGGLLIVGTAIWIALVVTNALALAIEGQEFMTVIGVNSDEESKPVGQRSE